MICRKQVTYISMAMLWNGEGRFEVDIVILSVFRVGF